jgi:hypothetical protein
MNWCHETKKLLTCLRASAERREGEEDGRACPPCEQGEGSGTPGKRWALVPNLTLMKMWILSQEVLRWHFLRRRTRGY